MSCSATSGNARASRSATGVTRDEIAEVITHMAFYAGWPNAVNAATVAKGVYDEG